MKHKNIRKDWLIGTVFLLFAMLCTACGAVAGQTDNGTSVVENGAATNSKEQSSEMEIHFMDVGQSDATLVKVDGHYMLIDAGDIGKGTSVQMYLKKQGVEKLDYFILTHPDADHIGGADVIVSKFEIGTVFMGAGEGSSKVYEELLDAFKYAGLKYTTPEVGEEYKLGEAVFTILAPAKTYKESNDNSIALLLEHGDTSVLFTGDCEEEAEHDILENNIDIDCDIYKVGHHGSRTSSSKELLEEVTPDYAVISCGENNSYGFPHAQTLNSLRAMGVRVFRTDEQGSVVLYSDGKEITWNCAPSDTWKAGESTESSKDKNTTNGKVSKTETSENLTETKGEQATATQQEFYYIVNKNNGKIHVPTCHTLPKEKNQIKFRTKEEVLNAGYTDTCGNCQPW